LFHTGRPLVGSDLPVAQDEPALRPDAAELGGRVSTLARHLGKAGDALAAAVQSDDPPGVLAVLTMLQGFGVSGAASIELASAAGNASLSDAQRALCAELISALKARSERLGTLSESTDLGIGALLSELVGRSIRSLPLLSGDGMEPALAAFSADAQLRDGDPAQPDLWLSQAALVRPDAARLADATQLAEEVAGRRLLDLVLGQDQRLEGESWAGFSRPPEGSRSRRCALAATPDRTLFDAESRPASIAGLTLDGWTELIPDGETTTGIGVHFDAPSARPPQAILLAVQPPNSGFTLDGVVDLLSQTVEQLRERAVVPDRIEGWGQYLPAVFLGSDAEPGSASNQGADT
jgi:hypothetical protein